VREFKEELEQLLMHHGERKASEKRAKSER
jgi:hypothetical protein